MSGNLVTSIIIRARDRTGAAFNRVRGNTNRLGNSVSDLKSKVVGLIAVYASFSGMKSLVTGFSELDTAIRKAAAVTGDFSSALPIFDEAAKRMGETTQFTSLQAAESLQKLAMAGLSVSDSVGALPEVLNLAAASGSDLGASADILTNIMSQYGFSVDELSTVNDKLVKTFTSSNTSLEELGNAFSYAGPIAKSAGQDFNEVAATLGILANNGFKGERGGTALRGAMARLIRPTRMVRNEIEALGFNINDSDGNMRSMVDIIAEMHDRSLSTASVIKIFGVEAGPAMAALISQGTDSINTLTTAIANSGGVAKQTANDMNSGIGGQLDLLSSGFDALAKSMGEGMSAGAAKGSKSLIIAFRDAKKPLTDLASSVAETTASLVTGFAKATTFLSKYSDEIGALGKAFIATKVASFVTGILSISTALAASTTATTAATVATRGLTAAMAINPITLFVGALALVGSTVSSVIESYKEKRAAADDLAAAEAELKKVNDDYIRSVNTLKSTHKDELGSRLSINEQIDIAVKKGKEEILEKSLLNKKINESAEANKALSKAQSDLSDDVGDTTDAIKKLSDDSISDLIKKIETANQSDLFVGTGWDDLKSGLIAEQFSRLGLDIEKISGSVTKVGRDGVQAFNAFANSAGTTKEQINRMATALVGAANTRADVDALTQAFRAQGLELESHPQLVAAIVDKIISMGGSLDSIPQKWRDIAGGINESASQMDNLKSKTQQWEQQMRSARQAQIAQIEDEYRAEKRLQDLKQQEKDKVEKKRLNQQAKGQSVSFNNVQKEAYKTLTPEQLDQLQKLQNESVFRAITTGFSSFNTGKYVEFLADKNKKANQPNKQGKNINVTFNANGQKSTGSFSSKTEADNFLNILKTAGSVT